MTARIAALEARYQAPVSAAASAGVKPVAKASASDSAAAQVAESEQPKTLFDAMKIVSAANPKLNATQARAEARKQFPGIQNVPWNMKSIR